MKPKALSWRDRPRQPVPPVSRAQPSFCRAEFSRTSFPSEPILPEYRDRCSIPFHRALNDDFSESSRLKDAANVFGVSKADSASSTVACIPAAEGGR
ncbi:hypothetical protein AM571_PC00485 (plasmid) [Rhizobium etli 8C-3]|uniref:Uncharacterized protein n=1 Tax=Rhizobium etli 8C-3 TaxID=538025 RepID=A0A1L5PDL3_RHIET|nr:hypothetical protein AM571_PC00485 [Rhizobium etli 8C-3]